MTVKAQILDMVDRIPENELPVLLEVVKRFVPVDIEDIATPEDLSAHKVAMEEYIAGETVSHDDIDWN